MRVSNSSRYQIRVASSRSDVERAQALRYRAFIENRPAPVRVRIVSIMTVSMTRATISSSRRRLAVN